MLCVIIDCEARAGSNWGLGFDWCERKVKWPSASLIIIHTEEASDEGPGHNDLSDLMKGPTQCYKHKRFPSLPLIPIAHLKREEKRKEKRQQKSIRYWIHISNNNF